MIDLLVPLAAIAALVLAGWMYQRVALAQDAKRFPPPGSLIKIESGRLHADVQGLGAPAVVFESGMASSSLAWSLVQPEIARFTQTISYDRFGLGWSDAVPQPRDIWRVVGELRALLVRANVPSPRIFVAHSYGGLIVRAYALRYPEEVAGIILLDPVAATEWSHPDQAHRKMLRHGIGISHVCAWLARLGILRFAMGRWQAISARLPQSSHDNGSNHGLGGLDRIVGQVKKLPREVWPVVQAHWCHPKCLDGMAEYLQELPSSAAAVQTVAAQSRMPNVPITILSAGNAGTVQRAEQETLAQSFLQAKLEIVTDSGHWIHFDRPEVVISAICEMVNVCRSAKTVLQRR